MISIRTRRYDTSHYVYRKAWWRIISLFSLFIVSAGACSPNPPQIQSVSTRLILYPGKTGIPEERLSVFIAVRDKDGIGDIEQVFIYTSAAELLWNLTSANWTIHKDAGEYWIGSNGLSSPSGIIPRDTYTIEIIDKAGEKIQKQIAVLAPQKLPGNLPAVSNGAQPGTLLIQSDYTQLTLFIFDSGNNVIKVFPAANGTVQLDKFWGNSSWKDQAVSCAVYAYDAKNQIGMFSWKVPINK